MKGQDGFTNSYEYLTKLMSYNYCDDGNMDVLKMLVWTLDGKSTSEDSADTDYNNPQNHYELLYNELYFLDNFIKTKEGTLSEDEATFSDYKQNKIDFFNELLQTENPATGENYKDYEVPYSYRPTTISDDEFETLYSLFKEKQSQCPSKITNSLSLIESIDSIPLDFTINSQEIAVENAVTSEDVVNDGYAAAEELKEKFDDIYVESLNQYWMEMWDTIKSLKDLVDERKDKLTDDKDSEGNAISYENETIFVLNIPNIRSIIDPNDLTSFWGMNIDPQYENCCGYRYAPWSYEKMDVDTFMQDKCRVAQTKYPDWFKNITAEVLPIVSVVNDLLMESKGEKGDAYNLTQQLDGYGYTFFYICQYYKKITTRNVQENQETGSAITTDEEEVVKWLCSIYDLPEDPDSIYVEKSYTWNRFCEINKRWVNINRLREDVMDNVGLRYQIESLFGITFSMDIKAQLSDALSDIKEQKLTYTNYLKELS